MPLIDYSKPVSFYDSSEAVCVVLQHALVQLRDHAMFHDDEEPSMLRAAETLSSLLEDAKMEIEQLIEHIEHKGATKP